MHFLTSWFGGFLRRRHNLRLFRRSALPGKPVAPGAVPAQRTRALWRAACDDIPGALVRLQSHEDGLSEAEAAERLRRVGPNEVDHEKPLPWWQHLWQCYRNPFNVLLTLLAVVSYLTEDLQATLVIGAMVLLSTLIRFVQEGRSQRSAERLKAMVGSTATVIRRALDAGAAGPGFPAPARGREVPMRALVPGDHILLSAGDMVPADCRVLTAKDLFVAQAAMTGESLPVEKFAERQQLAEGLLEQTNLLFMGTNVVSGVATAVVVATGNQTYFGQVAHRAVATDRAPTAFQAGVNSVSWLLIRFALVMVPLVLLLNGFTKGDWMEAFLFALSVAVGLTPEMLPMIVTSTLAKGAVVLSRQKVIVKRLDAIQNFGAMDVLCTDKTGTLTQDRIVLERHTDVFGHESREALHLAWLNSYHQTGLKNLLDRAVIEHLQLHPEPGLEAAWRKVDEIPFDFERRRMSVLLQPQAGGDTLLVCKGAVEEMLAVCTQVRDGDNTVALDAGMLARVRAVTEGLNAQGLRVVAVARRHLPASPLAAYGYGVADEAALTLVGYIAFLDPPKESTAPALQALAAHGVEVKVLTGDNELVAARVCEQVGLAGGQPVTGAQVERMGDAALAAAVQTHRLFARLTPLHKERIVHALRAQGRVVGFMGDGINDAPALRAADIGISVDGAVDIAKEAADIILLEKSLMVLEQGVVEGRRTFCNMLKYIRMTASSNFGNVFSVLVASVFLPFLPMLPLQLLVQNLLYDISQIAIPFDRVDDELVRQPLRWNPQDIGRFMLCFGPLSSVFDILCFGMMWWVFQANTPAQQALFQSGWFVVGLLTQTLIVHMIRTPRLPFIQSRAAWPLLLTTAAIMAVGIFLPMGPLAGHFKLQALPPLYWPLLAAILLGYAVLATWAKRAYMRRFGWQ
ncbi:MAG: magnesium-translocating P-type ATPase [Comamonadaceae bacterium SCN 68-20]|nr:MAG: magnesium-translocating P-type ATPase [Comamonadaceae bacterium SCN 68-20]OJX09849.1 MAG: magnesium-translocating P-type ATPase [Burkholderiales bacterium 68-20]